MGKANQFNEFADSTTEALQNASWQDSEFNEVEDASWETENADVNRVIAGLMQEAGVGMPEDLLLPDIPTSTGGRPGAPPNASVSLPVVSGDGSPADAGEHLHLHEHADAEGDDLAERLRRLRSE